MELPPVSRNTLTNVVAARLAAAILSGKLKSGEQLPSERELMKHLGVSRSTVREALKALEQSHLIEARSGVGWFVCALDARNLTRAHELAKAREGVEPPHNTQSQEKTSPAGPRRLPVAPEKPVRIPNLHKDRLGTFNFISWWEREKMQAARVLVVGAGALGNEVVKNLALMGVGFIFIVDFDLIEAANLSRSPLFRESDAGKKKAEVVAARAKELNNEIHVQYLHGDVTTQLGLGVVRRMDVIISCLDNREARLAVNRMAYWMNKPWVDGAIQELLGLMRVFVPGQGACFECTLTEEARRDLAVRYSCPLLARQNVLLGKVPTTPTIASIIGAMQSQEALKLIHGLPVEAGKVVHFNGMTNQMHTAAYRPRQDCESHWTFGEITELPLRSDTTTMGELLSIVRADLGDEAVLELDQELILSLTCPQCKAVEHVLRPIAEVTYEAAHCPACGTLREPLMTHVVSGGEAFLHRTLASLGVPPLHILRAYNHREYRFYELSGDLPEALHFSHFSESEPLSKEEIRKRIRLGERVGGTPGAGDRQVHIILRD